MQAVLDFMSRMFAEVCATCKILLIGQRGSAASFTLRYPLALDAYGMLKHAQVQDINGNQSSSLNGLPSLGHATSLSDGLQHLNICQHIWRRT